MFYRIEIYCSYEKKWERIDNQLPDIEESKKLCAPHFTKKRKFKGLFQFTEKEYSEIGKPMVKHLEKEKVTYRVKKIKEKALSVNWKDHYQVVGKRKCK